MAKEKRQSLFAGYVRAIVDWLWTAADVDASPVTRFVLASGRVGYIALKGFIDDLCMLRASALAFASTVALVPSLAISFAALRGLGWKGERLEALILSRATVLSPEAIETVVKYIDNTNFAGLGVIGGFVLFVTVLSVMANIEQAFNAIWGNATPRSPLRRVTDYFGVMVLCSILLAVAASATVMITRTALATDLEARWGFVSFAEQSMTYGVYGLVWFVFAFLYMFMPNTKVRALPALAGGIVAGSVWQLTQWTYIRFQAGVGTYNAIYGTLAQLPVLMAWLFLSWVIVLFGAEIAYAVQSLRSYRLDREARKGMGRRLEDYVALGVCGELARASTGLDVASSAEALAERLGVSPRLLSDVLAGLQQAGVVHSSERERGRWFLSLSPQAVSITSLLETFEGNLPPSSSAAESETGERVRNLLQQIAAVRADTLGGANLASLVIAQGSGAASEPRPA